MKPASKKTQSKASGSAVEKELAREAGAKPNARGLTSNVERVALEHSGYDLLYPPEEKVPS